MEEDLDVPFTREAGDEPDPFEPGPHFDGAGRDIGLLLGANVSDVYSTNKVVEEMLPLRRLNHDYGRHGGCKYGRSQLPEFDRCETVGCCSPLRRFDNYAGHFIAQPGVEGPNHPMTICLEPEVLPSIMEMALSVAGGLAPSLRHGRLWSLEGCKKCSRSPSGSWTFSDKVLGRDVSRSLDLLSVSLVAPLSVHSHHAWLEVDDSRDTMYATGMFCKPEETTAVSSLLGTLKNSQTVDMAPYEPEKVPDMGNRLRMLDIPSFVCRSHTSHSSEAGRVRHLCGDVRARVMNKKLIGKMVQACTAASKYDDGTGSWVLFCMGKMSMCTFESLKKLKSLIISSSARDIQTCTLDIRSETRCAILSVSSGVLLRRDIEGIVYSTTSMSSDEWGESKLDFTFPGPDRKESMRYFFSTFALLVPYFAYNRPPRTIIASVQSQQAVATPYGAGTSSVAPTYVSRPLVSTELQEEIVNHGSAGIADHMPGQNVLVGLHNDNDTYEDAIIISEGSTARGLYHYMAYSPYVLRSNEDVPEPGGAVNMDDNPWWKTYARKDTGVKQYSKKSGKSSRCYPTSTSGEGKVLSKGITQSGDVSVKTLRSSTPVSGDKLASWHGQKGVVKLRKAEDMPWGTDENGNVIAFDVLISLSSVVNRQTDGFIYEMLSSVDATRESRRVVLSSPWENNCSIGEPEAIEQYKGETVLYDGETGEMITRKDGYEDVPVVANWGFSFMWQMTQMNQDKEHYTHSTAGAGAINAPTGRSGGGGLRVSEIDFVEGRGSGIDSMMGEARSRMDLISTDICIRCHHVPQVCPCGDLAEMREVTTPHSSLVFDYSNILINGCATSYELEF